MNQERSGSEQGTAHAIKKCFAVSPSVTAHVMLVDVQEEYVF